MAQNSFSTSPLSEAARGRSDHDAAALTKKRILIVDDEESARTGLSELIESWGYETETADDGRSALNKIESFRPHLIVADLVMPRMDGLALLREIISADKRLIVVMPGCAVVELKHSG